MPNQPSAAPQADEVLTDRLIELIAPDRIETFTPAAKRKLLIGIGQAIHAYHNATTSSPDNNQWAKAAAKRIRMEVDGLSESDLRGFETELTLMAGIVLAEAPDFASPADAEGWAEAATNDILRLLGGRRDGLVSDSKDIAAIIRKHSDSRVAELEAALRSMYESGLVLVYHCRGLARTKQIAVTGVDDFDASLKQYEVAARTALG